MYNPKSKEMSSLTATELARIKRMTWSEVPEHHGMVVRIAHNINLAAKSGKKVEEAYVSEMLGKCAAYGINVIHWATRYIGAALYRSKVVMPFDGRLFINPPVGINPSEEYKSFARGILDAFGKGDLLDMGMRQAQHRRMVFLAHIPLFDHWHPMVPDKYYAENPNGLMINRAQTKHFPGLPCYVERESQDYFLAEVRELVMRGVDGISIDLTSNQAHYWAKEFGAPEPDTFGYNQTLVENYKQRFGVNPLFHKPDSEQWRIVQGEAITRFLRRVKTLLKDKTLVIGVTPSGYIGYGGYPGRGTSPDFGDGAPAFAAKIEWKKLLRDGIADGIMVYTKPGHTVEMIEAMRDEKKYGRIDLWMEPLSVKDVDVYKEKLRRVHQGHLDGYVIHEEAYFESEGAQTLWNIFDAQ